MLRSKSVGLTAHEMVTLEAITAEDNVPTFESEEFTAIIRLVSATFVECLARPTWSSWRQEEAP